MAKQQKTKNSIIDYADDLALVVVVVVVVDGRSHSTGMYKNTFTSNSLSH